MHSLHGSKRTQEVTRQDYNKQGLISLSVWLEYIFGPWKDAVYTTVSIKQLLLIITVSSLLTFFRSTSRLRARGRCDKNENDLRICVSSGHGNHRIKQVHRQL